MWKKFNRFLDRIESRYSLWQALAGFGIVGSGTLTASLSASAAFISSYGAFGWWLSFLGGCLIFTLSMALFQFAVRARAQAKALTDWPEKAGHINPLNSEYNKEAINFSDLRHPISSSIRDKRFSGCQFQGSSVLFFGNNTTLFDVTFGNCDFILTKKICACIQRN
jgi:hypothetical protein